MPNSHIRTVRLKDVGVRDVLFTAEESDHLKECSECFNQWSALIKTQGACKEKDQLMKKAHRAVRAYSDAVKSMVDMIGQLPTAEFDRISDIAEKTRRISLEARGQLRAHIDEHGC